MEIANVTDTSYAILEYPLARLESVKPYIFEVNITGPVNEFVIPIKLMK